MLKRILRAIAHRTGRLTWLYLRVARPSGEEWATFLKKWGGLRAIGNHCSIQTDVVLGDTYLLRLGDNVRLTGCTILGHDGSVNMINRAYGLKLDRVSKVDIGSNVFIGHGAVILPGVTIGNNVIVGAGAVVTHDVPSDSVVGGVPARRLSSLNQSVERLKEYNELLPWRELIGSRAKEYDAEMEPELRRLRVQYFFEGSGRTGCEESVVPTNREAS